MNRNILTENYKDNIRFDRQYEEISIFLQIVADNGYNEHFHWGRFDWGMTHSCLDVEMLSRNVCLGETTEFGDRRSIYMVYFSNGQITIRNMEYGDAQIITDAEIEQGWDASIDKYLKRIEDQRLGKAISLVAEYSEKPVGYINIYPNNTCGAFGGKGYPEIVDFGVLEKYRNHGIGTILMDIAEEIAATYADIVYLGVGLHSGYGSAQRMYVKRGYIPDGSGVWYQDKICKPYEECKNDDDLVLYLSKKL